MWLGSWWSARDRTGSTLELSSYLVDSSYPRSDRRIYYELGRAYYDLPTSLRKKLGPIKYRGLFIARQEEVSKKYSNVFATQVLTARNVLEEILYKRAARTLVETIQAETESAASRLNLAGQLDEENKGEDSDFENTKKEVIRKVSDSLAGSSTKLETYMGRAMSIENNMFKRMKDLPPEEFEPILRSAFQEDEYVLILIGSVLGAIVGLVQGIYMITV